MVRVDSAAFSLSTLLFVKAFILRIKPTYTYPLFVVLRSIGDTEISTTDEVTYSGVLALHDGACTNGMLGAATMWDEPRPAGGGWRSQYDTGVDPNNPLVYPTAQPVQWGFDKDLLCPEDYIDCQVCITWAGGVPTFDSIFAWDTEIFSSVPIVFSDANITAVPASGIVLFSPFTVTANASLTELCLTIDGSPQASDPNYTIIVSQNGTDVATFSFVELEGAPLYQATFTFSPAISVVIGDLLSVRIVPDTGPTSPYWQNIVVEIGSSVAWSYDTVLAAGTYCIYKAL
jgi:hypothetical protein